MPVSCDDHFPIRHRATTNTQRPRHPHGGDDCSCSRSSLGSSKVRGVTLRLVVSTLLAATIFATTVAAPAAESYSQYEQETLDLALERHAGTLDPAPEGKRITRIDVDVLDVIEERDPIPGFLNALHANTRDYVVRRELLFRSGRRYEQSRVSETERNLRALRQESLVIIVPLRTEEPGEVRVLVLVKDVWSLRLNSDYRFKNGQLEYLFLQPAEENLLGTHRRVFGNFAYEPDTLTVGAQAIDPRVAGSRHLAALSGNVLINHGSGEVEGSQGSFRYGVPLYSTRQRWAWGALAVWQVETTRRFVGLDLAAYDAAVTPEVVDLIPYVYDSEIISGRYGVTRSFGTGVKHDVELGFEASRSVFRLPDLSGFDPAAVQEFSDNELPVGETRIGPYAQYHLHMADFTSLLDVNSLALQENYRLGPEMNLRFYPVIRALGSTRNVLGFNAATAFTADLGNSLWRSYGSGTIEIEPDGTVSDALVQPGLQLVSPSLWLGRLVYDGTLIYRPRNFLNRQNSLGGDGRLRGYPSRAFVGKDVIASNVEFRTHPLQLWTFQLAGALFYDVGDAFDDFEDLSETQAPKRGPTQGTRGVPPWIYSRGRAPNNLKTTHRGS